MQLVNVGLMVKIKGFELFGLIVTVVNEDLMWLRM